MGVNKSEIIFSFYDITLTLQTHQVKASTAASFMGNIHMKPKKLLIT